MRICEELYGNRKGKTRNNCFEKCIERYSITDIISSVFVLPKFTVTDASMHSKPIAAARNMGLDNGAIFGNSLSELHDEHKVNLNHGIVILKVLTGICLL